MDVEKKRIGQRIRDARASANLTQVQVSEQTGITQNRLSDYERGAVMPELASLIRIAPVLGVQVSELID